MLVLKIDGRETRLAVTRGTFDAAGAMAAALARIEGDLWSTNDYASEGPATLRSAGKGVK